MPDTRRMLTGLRRILFYLLPVVLLYVILNRVDFAQLLESLQDTTPLYILLGVGLRPLQMVLGAFRWRLITNHCANTRLPARFMLREYWAGVAVGYFTPGGIGWEAYRIMALGRRLKAYMTAFATILAEKVIGLFAVLTMCLAIFPWVVNRMMGETVVFRRVYVLLLVAALAAALLAIVAVRVRAHPWVRRVRDYGDRFIVRCIRAIKNERMAEAVLRDYRKSRNPLTILRKPSLLAAAFLYSVGILVTAAVCSQFIFIGLDHDINFLINLFAAPLFFLILLIPISFGGIGVREGAFILVYGQFGVPLEIALLVSFFNLFGLILNNVIGAGLLWRSGMLKRTAATADGQPL
jgi:glycosyltransferase 2 family protein